MGASTLCAYREMMRLDRGVDGVVSTRRVKYPHHPEEDAVR